jgi:hypothetical protein
MDEVLSKEFNFKPMQGLAIKNKLLDTLRTREDTNHLLHARCDYSKDEILTALYALKAENYQIPQRGLPGTFVNVFMCKLESDSNS